MSKQGDTIIYGAASTLAVVGFCNPIPFADHVILLATWAGMLGTMAHSFDVTFDEDAFFKILKQLLMSIGAYAVGISLFIGLAKLTGVGTLPAAIINAALNFSFTWAIGNVYRNAWSEDRDPTFAEVEQNLRAAFELVRSKATISHGRLLKKRYNELRGGGLDMKDALLKLLSDEFQVG